MTQIINLGKLRFNFAGEWLPDTVYELNDVARYGGGVYVYTNPVRQAGTNPTSSNWALLVEGFSFTGSFNIAAPYKVGHSVSYGGKVYICIQDSTGILPTNPAYWSLFADGIQYEGEYNNSVSYQKNDVVKYGNSSYIAKQDTFGVLPTNTANWELFLTGISPSSVWNSSVTYYLNSLVVYGNKTYIATATNINLRPDLNPAEWTLFTSGVSVRGPWATATAYNEADIVSYGGNTYSAVLSHTSANFATDLAANRWVKFNSGIRYRGPWAPTTAYLKDDIFYDSIRSTYIVLQDFTSSANMAADIETANVSLLAKGAEVSGIPEMNASTERKTLGNEGGVLVWKTQDGFRMSYLLEMSMK